MSRPGEPGPAVDQLVFGPGEHGVACRGSSLPGGRSRAWENRLLPLVRLQSLHDHDVPDTSLSYFAFDQLGVAVVRRRNDGWSSARGSAHALVGAPTVLTPRRALCLAGWGGWLGDADPARRLAGIDGGDLPTVPADGRRASPGWLTALVAAHLRDPYGNLTVVGAEHADRVPLLRELLDVLTEVWAGAELVRRWTFSTHEQSVHQRLKDAAEVIFLGDYERGVTQYAGSLVRLDSAPADDWQAEAATALVAEYRRGDVAGLATLLSRVRLREVADVRGRLDALRDVVAARASGGVLALGGSDPSVDGPSARDAAGAEAGAGGVRRGTDPVVFSGGDAARRPFAGAAFPGGDTTHRTAAPDSAGRATGDRSAPDHSAPDHSAPNHSATDRDATEPNVVERSAIEQDAGRQGTTGGGVTGGGPESPGHDSPGPESPGHDGRGQDVGTTGDTTRFPAARTVDGLRPHAGQAAPPTRLDLARALVAADRPEEAARALDALAAAGPEESPGGRFALRGVLFDRRFVGDGHDAEARIDVVGRRLPHLYRAVTRLCFGDRMEDLRLDDRRTLVELSLIVADRRTSPALVRAVEEQSVAAGRSDLLLPAVGVRELRHRGLPAGPPDWSAAWCADPAAHRPPEPPPPPAARPEPVPLPAVSTWQDILRSVPMLVLMGALLFLVGLVLGVVQSA
ncbi:hypothetical protein [Saccharothrix australiensis]|uniref:Uncharacterized protein n=1 Tax=Saccharothrix australiensis TaxID=2072 RepID=A0A495W2Y0_9PSEU|nr:hypothetical protein [Saccharothrix australiensis]RKT55397.1 hypothetical protein C8E97_4065 [Saccharothrix australiensis]